MESTLEKLVEALGELAEAFDRNTEALDRATQAAKEDFAPEVESVVLMDDEQ